MHFTTTAKAPCEPQSQLVGYHQLQREKKETPIPGQNGDKSTHISHTSTLPTSASAQAPRYWLRKSAHTLTHTLPQVPRRHGLDGRTRHLLRGRARALGLRADSLALLLHTLQGVHHLSQYLATQGALTASIQPWPIVERFLKEQDDGAIGADVGCGNGKYLAVNERVFVVGSDRYVCAVSVSAV